MSYKWAFFFFLRSVYIGEYFILGQCTLSAVSLLSRELPETPCLPLSLSVLQTFPLRSANNEGYFTWGTSSAVLRLPFQTFYWNYILSSYALPTVQDLFQLVNKDRHFALRATCLIACVSDFIRGISHDHISLILN
jgi:hypothetical protein